MDFLHFLFPLLLPLAIIAHGAAWRYRTRIPLLPACALGIASASAMLVVLATPWYWLASYTKEIALILTGITTGIPLALLLFWKKNNHHTHISLESSAIDPERSGEKNPFHVPALIALYGILLSTLGAGIFFSHTQHSLLGPWEAVSGWFFVLFFLLALTLILITIRWQSTQGRLVLWILFCALSYIAGTLLFPYGFGFDPFIHQAAEKHILIHGSITPKTPYYIGHYILVVTMGHLVPFVPFDIVDRLITPLLAALTVPAALWYALQSTPQRTWSILGALMIIGYGAYTLSTPWGLSVLFFTLTLCMIQNSKAPMAHTLAVLFALCSFCIHPLAGIGALLTCALSLVRHYTHPPLRTAMSLLGITAGVAAYVGALIIGSHRGGLVVAPTAPHEIAERSITFLRTLFSFTTRFDGVIDFVYLGTHAAPPVLFILAIGSLILHKKNTPYASPLITPLYTALALILSAASILVGISIPELPIKEQSDYGLRLLSIALIPLCIAASPLIEKGSLILTTSRFPGFRYVTALVLAGALTSGIYLSYPHRDAYSASHAYTLATADIEAVRWIETHTPTQDYVVLSNQIIAAAALREFGFERSFPMQYNNSTQEQYFYPIPTTGPLAREYEALIANPGRDVPSRVATATDKRTVFVILPIYESDLERKKASLEKEADATMTIRNERYIYRFDFR